MFKWFNAFVIVSHKTSLTMEYEGMKALRRGTFTVTQTVFDASFADFTPSAGVYDTFNYYGDWWNTEVEADSVGWCSLTPG